MKYVIQNIFLIECGYNKFMETYIPIRD